MIIDRADVNIIQNRHHLLCQPDVLILIANFNAVLLIADGSNVRQVLRRT